MSKSAEHKQHNKKQNQGKKPRTAITPTREEDFPEWYQKLLRIWAFKTPIFRY